jgi:carbamoyltransferase
MLFVATVRENKRNIPAVTHVDGSARLQTISREQNALYYKLIEEFERQSGCPVIINTSFNVRGEPIVCSPEEAWRCFLRTEMNLLVMGSYIVYKNEIPQNLIDEAKKEKFELD